MHVAHRRLDERVWRIGPVFIALRLDDLRLYPC